MFADMQSETASSGFTPNSPSSVLASSMATGLRRREGAAVHSPFDGEIVRAVDGVAERGWIHPVRELALVLNNTVTFRPAEVPFTPRQPHHRRKRRPLRWRRQPGAGCHPEECRPAWPCYTRCTCDCVCICHTQPVKARLASAERADQQRGVSVLDRSC